MKVVSLFDGIACGYEALKRAGIPVSAYYAFEIDKHAIQIAKKNHPDIIHMGSVVDFPFWILGGADLVMGGSPCQGFSFAGKQLAFDDPRSKLFFEFVRAINEIKPKHYLLENVKMKKEFQDVITHYMGVNPVEINSAKLSAQNRKRLYWCNWDVPQPEDKGILLKDIIEDAVDVSVFGAAQRGRYLIDGKCADTKVDSMAGLTEQRIDISPEEKSNCLISVQKDSLLAILQAENPRVAGLADVEGGIRPFKDDGRKGSLSEYGRIAFEDSKAVTVSAAHAPKILQTARGNNPGGLRALDGKVPCLSANSWEYNNHLIFIGGFEEGRRLEDGKNLSRNFSEGYRVYSAEGKTATLTAQSKGGLGGAIGLYAIEMNDRQKAQYRSLDEKGNCLLSSSWKGMQANGMMNVSVDGVTIRKLTPVECERLQTLPDNYTLGISNTQRYKALGNGWTVDVIAHIFNQLKKESKQC